MCVCVCVCARKSLGLSVRPSMSDSFLQNSALSISDEALACRGADRKRSSDTLLRPSARCTVVVMVQASNA